MATCSGIPEAILIRDVSEFANMPRKQIWSYTDSAAARGISSRQGCGKLKRFEVRWFWAQQLARAKEIALLAANAEDNLADLRT
eukprot:6019324-Alexandrium_andersonii.AAC.1